MSQATAFSRVTSSDIWGKILCFADNIHTAEVNKVFKERTEKAMSLEWTAMSKDNRLRASIQSLPEQNLDLNKISSCFAALFAKHKELDFRLGGGQKYFDGHLQAFRGTFAAPRFIDAERDISAEADRNMMLFAGWLIVQLGADATPDRLRNWIKDPQNAHHLLGIETVDLSGLGLTMVPPEILYLKDLTRIDVSNNNLINMPSFLTRLPNLNSICLYNNPLEVIAPEVWPYLVYYDCGLDRFARHIPPTVQEVPFIVWFRTRCLIKVSVFDAVSNFLNPTLDPLVRRLENFFEKQDRVFGCIVMAFFISTMLLVCVPLYIIEFAIVVINITLQMVVAPALDFLRRLLCLPNRIRIN